MSFTGSSAISSKEEAALLALKRATPSSSSSTHGGMAASPARPGHRADALQFLAQLRRRKIGIDRQDGGVGRDGDVQQRRFRPTLKSDADARGRADARCGKLGADLPDMAHQAAERKSAEAALTMAGAPGSRTA